MTMGHAPLHFEQSSLPTGPLGLSILLFCSNILGILMETGLCKTQEMTDPLFRSQGFGPRSKAVDMPLFRVRVPCLSCRIRSRLASRSFIAGNSSPLPTFLPVAVKSSIHILPFTLSSSNTLLLSSCSSFERPLDSQDKFPNYPRLFILVSSHPVHPV